MLTDSILITTKKLLGLADDYTPFDTEIILHINTYLGVLNQLGVGITGFTITDDTETWADFLGETTQLPLSEIKTYLFLRVKMVFDPPTSGIVSTAINENINELGWRIREAVEHEQGLKG